MEVSKHMWESSGGGRGGGSSGNRLPNSWSAGGIQGLVAGSHPSACSSTTVGRTCPGSRNDPCTDRRGWCRTQVLCAIVRWLPGCLLPCCLVSRVTTNQNSPACLPDYLCRTRNRNISMWKRDLVVLYLRLVKDVEYDCTVVSHCPNTWSYLRNVMAVSENE